MTLPLSSSEHERDHAGRRYIYAVVSRRAGGISVGVNLNPNSACNWRCVYCQVPGLTRGGPPPIELDRLARELDETLAELQRPDASGALPHIEDVAFSGNGESTLAPEFPAAVARVRAVLAARGLHAQVMLRLITNGSQVTHASAQAGLREIAAAGGEVWFKIDRGSREAIARVNDVHLEPATVIERLAVCASLVPTWIQSCFFGWDGAPPEEAEVEDYVNLLGRAVDRGMGANLRGVLLYGVARTSHQPEAGRLTRLSSNELEQIADRIRKKGLTVRVSP